MATVTKPMLLDETFSKEMEGLAAVLAGIAKGALPVRNHTQTSGTVEIVPNITNVFPKLTGGLTVSFAAASEELDYEWVAVIPMGATPQSVNLPVIEWYLGIEPTFEANTTTEIRVHKVGDVYKGVWLA